MDKSFFEALSAVCETFVRLMVSNYFDNHSYSENCQFWDKLNEASRNICLDMNPYRDIRYVSISDLRRR